jgi:hypothetical protein
MIFSSENQQETLKELLILLEKLIIIDKEISEKFEQAISSVN